MNYPPRRFQRRLSVLLTWLMLVGGLLVAGSALPAQADDASAALLGKEEAAFRAAVELAAPAVVQIETFGGLERVGEELLAEGPTTGTIVGSEGWIISSLHSLRQQPASILVTLPDGQRAAARIVARDFSRELALLKVSVERELPVAVAAELDSVVVGNWTVALGKTYDKSQVSQSVGIISALGRAYGKAVQTDAKVSPINYGGPLIDLQGRVIGILAPITPGTFFDRDSSELYDSGIGFAIPLVDILPRLPHMQAGNDIHPGKLGVVSLNQNELAGPVRLTGAAPGSPAAKAGMKAEDVIVEAGGKPVRLLAELRHALAQVDAGETLQLTVRRGGERLDLSCELTREIPVYRRRYLGLRLAENPTGLTITHIEPGSPASRATELSVGDRIIECNQQPIKSREELAGPLAVAELDQPLELTVLGSDEQEKTIQLLAETWPEDLPETLPPIAATVDPKAEATLTEVTLGDVPNKAYAIVPPPLADRELGLCLVFPEPGESDRDKTLNQWKAFARDYGWIIAVIESGNPQAWSMEEVELAGRVIGRLDKAYRLDTTRCVACGWGVGGRVALAAATSDRQRIHGVITLGTDLGRMSLRQQNAPLQSLDFLLVGDPQKLESHAAALNENGFAANVLPAPALETGKWETLPLEKITRWLEGQGRL